MTGVFGVLRRPVWSNWGERSGQERGWLASLEPRGDATDFDLFVFDILPSSNRYQNEVTRATILSRSKPKMLRRFDTPMFLRRF